MGFAVDAEEEEEKEEGNDCGSGPFVTLGEKFFWGGNASTTIYFKHYRVKVFDTQLDYGTQWWWWWRL